MVSARTIRRAANRKKKARIPPAHRSELYRCNSCGNQQPQKPFEFDRSFKPRCLACGGNLESLKDYRYVRVPNRPTRIITSQN